MLSYLLNIIQGGCTGSSKYTCQNATLLEITCRGSIVLCAIDSVSIYEKCFKGISVKIPKQILTDRTHLSNLYHGQLVI